MIAPTRWAKSNDCCRSTSTGADSGCCACHSSSGGGPWINVGGSWSATTWSTCRRIRRHRRSPGLGSGVVMTTSPKVATRPTSIAVEHYRKGRLLPGMVITVEPGLYFKADDLLVACRVAGYRGADRGRCLDYIDGQ